MKNSVHFFFLIILVMSITSCAPRYYAPDTHNVPLFSGKGETNLEVAGNTERIEIQASHAITSNIGLKANGGFLLPRNFETSRGGSGRMMEIGVGYYTPMKGKWIFETYGNVAFGSAENVSEGNTIDILDVEGMLTNKFKRFSIQPNIGFKTEDIVFAFSTRFGGLFMSDFEGVLNFNGVDQKSYLMRNDAHFLIEPALTIKGVWNNFTFGAQMGYSGNVTKTDFQQYKSYMVLTLGYRFNSKYSSDD